MTLHVSSSTTLHLCLVFSVTLGLVACQSAPEPVAKQELDAQCESPRPEFCTREYRPVCALKDSGVRCVTTPCPSTEWKSYGNACDACSDEKVIGYRQGSCDIKEDS